MAKYYYGITSHRHLLDVIGKVVTAFGGGYNARALLLGTCATETHCGTFPDIHPDRLGVGIGQCDQIRLDDTKMHIRAHDRERLLDLGYDIDKVELIDLAYDPVLAISIMRLAYKRIPVVIPSCDDLLGLANYWKDHYNSHHPNAAGTPEKFILDWKCHISQ